MDRNTFTGLFLILIILVGSTFLMKPSEEELKRERQVQDSIAAAKKGQPAKSENFNATRKPDAAAQAAAPVDSSLLKGPFGSARTGDNQPVVLENDLMKIYISPKGGRIATVELKDFKTYDQKPLILFNADESRFNLSFTAAGASIQTQDLYFRPSASAVKVSKSDSSSVTMRLSYADGRYIDYIYSLKGDSYKVGFAIASQGMEGILPANQSLSLDWEASYRQKEKDLVNEQRYSTTVYRTLEEDVENLSVSEDESKEITEGKLQWVSFKQHFFSSALIARNGFEKGTLAVKTSIEPGVVKSFAARLQLPALNQLGNFPMEFYFGPNKFSTLKAQGYDLERQVDMGYWPLKYINRYAVLPLFNFLEQFNWSYGLIILVLTIVLKLVLFPLTYKSYLSMAKMRVLKPEMDEIKTKVGEDNPTLLQQEYLKLYKKAGVNPLGGCLPMLLQLPIVMAFFFFFPNLFELRQESFLWMKDLSTYDAMITFPRIPLIGMDHISLMCILMTISTLIYTYFNNQISGATGQMKYIGYITPIIFLGVLNSYPAGLNYYYFLANMLSFVQQYIIRQFVNDDKIHARIQENKKKPDSGKKSKFQARMEEYMRQQQAAAKQQPKKK
ncbi:MAG TPA: membrane protein insertase YidC [Sphingobacteriaceae bacterium]